MAEASALAVAQVSAPAKARSVSSIAWSTPTAMTPRSICAADGTPMLIAMTLLPSQRAIIDVSQRYGSGCMPPVPSKQISNM